MNTSGFLRLADVDVHAKRVFIRSDLNVPQDEALRITDDTRIRASVPAIQDALTRGAAVMDETLALLVEYGGLEKASAGKATDYYTNDFLP